MLALYEAKCQMAYSFLSISVWVNHRIGFERWEPQAVLLLAWIFGNKNASCLLKLVFRCSGTRRADGCNLRLWPRRKGGDVTARTHYHAALNPRFLWKAKGWMHFSLHIITVFWQPLWGMVPSQWNVPDLILTNHKDHSLHSPISAPFIAAVG